MKTSTAETHGAVNTHKLPLALTQQIPKNVLTIKISALTISASLKLEKNTKAASPLTKLPIHLLINSSTRLIPKNAWTIILNALLPFVGTHLSRTQVNAWITIAKQMLITALMISRTASLITIRIPYIAQPLIASLNHQITNAFPIKMCPTATLVKVRVMREFVYGMKNTTVQNTQIY